MQLRSSTKCQLIFLVHYNVCAPALAHFLKQKTEATELGRICQRDKKFTLDIIGRRQFLTTFRALVNSRDPFLERPGKLTGLVSYFKIKVSRKVGCVLASIEVHFVSLAENFTV